MKCLVLSFFMEYNGRTYKRGDYVDVADEASIKRLVRERCVELIPSEVANIAEVEEVKPPLPHSFLNVIEKEENVEDSIINEKSMVRKQVHRQRGGIKK